MKGPNGGWAPRALPLLAELAQPLLVRFRGCSFSLGKGTQIWALKRPARGRRSLEASPLFLYCEMLSLPAAWCFWKPLQGCFSHLGCHCSPWCSQEHRSALLTAPCSAGWCLASLLPARRAHLFAPVVPRRSGISC